MVTAACCASAATARSPAAAAVVGNAIVAGVGGVDALHRRREGGGCYVGWVVEAGRHGGDCRDTTSGGRAVVHLVSTYKLAIVVRMLTVVQLRVAV